MKKLVLTLSAVLMLVAFTFAGCNKSAEKPTAPTATKKAPATKAPSTTPATPAPATK